MADRFLIAAPYTGDSGLQTDLKPYAVPDQAFERLINAYVFRGRVRKRVGARLMNVTSNNPNDSRFRIALTGGAGVGTTDGAGNAAGTVPGATFAIGQMFSIGSQLFTVNALGAPAPMLNTGGGAATYNTNTGAYVFAGVTANTQIYFYPAQPVMGFLNYETNAISDEPTYGFDTQFAYQFSTITGGWERLGTATWTGSNSQFFWGTTYRGATDNVNLLFVTNYNAADLIKYWNGATWTNYNPLYAPGQTIQTARIIIPFKNRLVLLNTIETVGGINTTFVNRCRFSQDGSPLDVDAFREDIPGRGDRIDLPVQEAIVTAQLLKDRLIVYAESSTWELVFTGNQILPFVWQQINTELGAESTFSQVPFDKVVLGVGNVGIHACNGINVDRIDSKIPDFVFDFHNGNDGVQRVYGIRDYFLEMIYWTFPDPNLSFQNNPTFPNRMLVYNYKTGAWAINFDSITAFGYYQNPSDIPPGIGQFQSGFRNIIAGNQEGYTFLLQPDNAANTPALQITNIVNLGGGIIELTIINHNLAAAIDPDEREYIKIENVQGMTGLNGNIYLADAVTSVNTVQITQAGVTGVYTGGGTVRRVSKIDILTKQYNFYAQQGRNMSVDKVDLLVDRTTSGTPPVAAQLTVDYLISSSNTSLVTDGTTTGSILGNAGLDTYPYTPTNTPAVTGDIENTQTRLWRSIYPQAVGECVQLNLFLNDTQMKDSTLSERDFQLHAMLFYCNPTSARFQ